MYLIIYVLSLFLLLYITYWTVKLKNPYKLIMIMGKKGSGKSTSMLVYAYKHYKKGWKVYSTSHIPYAYYVDSTLIGRVQFPPHSVLLIDEVGMLWDNRNFKSFPEYLRDWFKYQRHYKVKVYLFSQSYDVDKKIRDLVDYLFISKTFLCFSWHKKVARRLTITQPQADREGMITDSFEFVSFLWWPFGSRKLIFIPRWIRAFDSYEAPKLKDMGVSMIYTPKIPTIFGRLKEKCGKFIKNLKIKLQLCFVRVLFWFSARRLKHKR